MSYNYNDMKTLYQYVAPALGVILALFAIFGSHPVSFSAATANPSSNALYEQALAQPLGTTDANMYVTSGADVQGNLLAIGSYQCLSVDTGQPNFEAICGNVSSSSTSGLTIAVTLRGLSTQTATTSNPAAIFTHRRGADVRITDFPSLTIVNNELSGVQNIPYLLNYDNSVLIGPSSASTTIPTKYYVDNEAASGGSPGSPTVAGIFLGSTAAQTASSTATGVFNTVTYNRILQTGNATDTPQAKCNSLGSGNGAGCSVIALLTGKITQAWLDLTAAFSVSGAWVFTNTVSIAASSLDKLTLNAVPYIFPSSQGAANSILSNNGSGTLSWTTASAPRYSYASTTASVATVANGGFATSTSMTIPAGTLTASSTITFQGEASGCDGSTTCTFFLWSKVSGTWTKIAGGTIGQPASGRNWDIDWTGYVTNNSVTNSQSSVMQSNAIDAGTISSIVAGKILTQGLTSSIDTTQAVTLVGVVSDSSNSGGLSFNSLFITVSP